MASVALKLSWLTANNAYAFTFGDSLLRLDGESLFYETHLDASQAAKRHGLKVSKAGGVRVASSTFTGWAVFKEIK